MPLNDGPQSSRSHRPFQLKTHSLLVRTIKVVVGDFNRLPERFELDP